MLTQTWTADGQRASLADADGNILTRKTRAGGTPLAFAYDTLNRLATKTRYGPRRS